MRIPRTRCAGGSAMLWGRLPLDGVGSCRLFFTDDLHDNLSWVPASDKPHTFKSCFTHSSQVFFGRPGSFQTEIIHKTTVNLTKSQTGISQHLLHKCWRFYWCKFPWNLCYFASAPEFCTLRSFFYKQPKQQDSWCQHGTHLGPVGLRWVPC